ncbi:MAG: hypothetical protein WDZ31_00785 [Phycisphaeraceae bacterium]
MALAPLAGCGEEPRSAAQRHLDAAIHTVSQAQYGFVPEGEDMPLADYRLQTLEQAVSDLQQVIDQGTREQQIAAQSMLADIHAAAARAHRREAGDQFAALSKRSGSVLSHLAAYERAHGRVARLDRDRALLREQINEEIREQRTRHEQLQSRREQLQEEREDLQARQDALQEDVDTAQARARQLRDQAFVAEGDEQYDLEEEAAQLLLEGEKQAIEAEQLGIQIDLVQTDLTLTEQQLASIDKLVEDLQAQVEEVQTQTQQMTDRRAEAEADRTEALDVLRNEYEQLTQAYQSAVRSRFEDARQRAGQATDQVGQTPDRTAQLARRVEQSQILADQIAAIGSLGQVLQVVVDRVEQVQPEQARAFSNSLAELIEQQYRLMEQAEQTLDAARTAADELAGSGGDTGAFAQQQQARLDAHRERIRNADLDG